MLLTFAKSIVPLTHHLALVVIAVNGLTTAHHRMAGDVKSMKGSIIVLKEDVAVLKVEVATLKEAVQHLAASVASLATSVEQLRVDFASMAKKM